MEDKPDYFLFEQLPPELNLTILHLFKPDDWIKVSRTCKRWLNNTNFFTDLKLELTRRPLKVPDHSRRNTKTRAFKDAPLNLVGIATYLSRFKPESLRSLELWPGLQQPCEPLNKFLVKCTGLRSLRCFNSSNLYTTIGSLTQLKSLHFDGTLQNGAFADLLKQLINLEELEFNVAHATWKEIPIKTFYSDLVKLKSLRINSAVNTYIKYEYIGKMTQLTRLELPYAYIADDEFKHFADLTNLEYLGLNSLQKVIPADEITMEDSDEGEDIIGNEDPLNGLRHLTRLTKLTYLDISNVPQLYDLGGTDETKMNIAHLIHKHFTNLKTLKISASELERQNKQKLHEIKRLSLVIQ